MKDEIIKQIRDLMKEHGISVGDLVEYYSKGNFDLLVNVHASHMRVPTNVALSLGVPIVGIFPFEDSNIYFELNEKPEQTRHNVDESRVPTLDFWKRVFTIKDDLNKHLKQLETLTIDGYYFANPKRKINDVSYIIGIMERDDHLTYDYYDDKITAKVRYCGVFKD